jgi:hypothetical protein
VERRFGLSGARCRFVLSENGVSRVDAARSIKGVNDAIL